MTEGTNLVGLKERRVTEGTTLVGLKERRVTFFPNILNIDMSYYHPNELPTILLDIRSRKEYCFYHLPGAILVETNAVPESPAEFEMLKRKLLRVVKHLPKNTPIYVYCKLGLRAREAVNILRGDLGYTNVIWLGGVMTEPIKSEIFVKGRIARC